jgi:hypothetical protein
MDEQLVERMHACLAEALVRGRERPFETPVSVAEIYQDLVPYRTVRGLIGFEMNADYEHTLLRLLAGEGDLARLEPVEARDELRDELNSPNPNVGLFRKFAACDVFVAVPRGVPVLPAVAQAPVVTHGVTNAFDAWESRSAIWKAPGEPAAEEGSDASALEPGAPVEWADEPLELLLEEEVVEVEAAVSSRAEVPAGGVPFERAATAVPGPPREPEDAGVQAASEPSFLNEAPPAVAAASRCAFCDAGLPQGRTVRFCPFCGADQAKVPCSDCGEPLERAWLYCIACGASAPLPST